MLKNDKIKDNSDVINNEIRNNNTKLNEINNLVEKYEQNEELNNELLIERYEKNEELNSELLIKRYDKNEELNSGLIKDKDDFQKQKDIDDIKQEANINKYIHTLIVEALGGKSSITPEKNNDSIVEVTYIEHRTNFIKNWIKNKFSILNENNLNKVLPALRIQYIKDWQTYIRGDEEGEIDTKKIKEAKELIKSFDNILIEKQKRDQKKEVFTKIFAFFFFETIALFTIIILNGFNFGGFEIKDTTLQIISGVTITQVAAMLMFIVQNLYPKSSDLNDDELKEIKNLLNTQKD